MTSKEWNTKWVEEISSKEERYIFAVFCSDINLEKGTGCNLMIGGPSGMTKEQSLEFRRLFIEMLRSYLKDEDEGKISIDFRDDKES